MGVMGKRSLSRESMERELERLRCAKNIGYSTASRWMPRTGYQFTVPNDCSQGEWDEILNEIRPHLGDLGPPKNSPEIS